MISSIIDPHTTGGRLTPTTAVDLSSRFNLTAVLHGLKYDYWVSSDDADVCNQRVKSEECHFS